MNSKSSVVTMYVVRDSYQRTFLGNRAYSGRSAKWRRLPDAYLFQTEAQAQSCASNINARSPGCRVARVRTVRITR